MAPAHPHATSVTVYPALFHLHPNNQNEKNKTKQGRIHGKTVADGWEGAVIQKLLVIQKSLGQIDGWTDGRTDTARCRVACPRLKMIQKIRETDFFNSQVSKQLRQTYIVLKW